MPEASEMKWLYMVLVLGVLYGMKKEPESTRNWVGGVRRKVAAKQST